MSPDPPPVPILPTLPAPVRNWTVLAVAALLIAAIAGSVASFLFMPMATASLASAAVLAFAAGEAARLMASLAGQQAGDKATQDGVALVQDAVNGHRAALEARISTLERALTDAGLSTPPTPMPTTPPMVPPQGERPGPQRDKP